MNVSEHTTTFDGLELDELAGLKPRLEAAIEAARQKRIETTRTEIEAILTRASLALADVFPTPSKPARKRMRPKYRDPDNPENVWSGRGKKHPQWLEDRLAAGADLEDFLT